AKAWAEVHKKPIAAVSALESVAAQVRLEGLNSSKGSLPVVVPMLDARRGQVYAGVYRPNTPSAGSAESARNGLGIDDLTRVGEERVMAAAEFLAILRGEVADDPVIFATPTPEILAAALAASPYRNSQVVKASAVLAPSIGLLGLAHSRRGKLVDALHLEANYVRQSDAELVFKTTRA
ncbi:MAG: tRNA threonylcarbamoyladenosine biosynthesis protein TsaB, partial [Candidatus Acidiferrales bacterium]